MGFSMGNVIKSSEVFTPPKILIFGVAGIGKSTFAATFERPIFLRTEDGLQALDVATFDAVAKTYADVIGGIGALYQEEHDFKTLVLDSIDWLEPLVWAATCARLTNETGRQVSSIEEPGYGKGYVEADREWRNLIAGFDALVAEKKMQIVLLAHCEVKTINPPDGPSFDCYQPKLHKRASALLQEWAENVLFLNFRTQAIKTRDGGRSGTDKFRGVGQGERVIFTEERPAYKAKTRWAVPAEIFVGTDLTWQPFHVALAEASNGKYHNPVTEGE